MDIQDAQRESRSVFIGGFWGQLVSSTIWLVSAALGTWVTPKASILAVVIGGFFIFPLTQLMLRLSGRRATLSRENPFNYLGMQVAFVLPFSMLLLVPVGLYNLNWFFPALMVLLGAHYLPFGTLYGMPMFLFLAGILIAAGVVIVEILPVKDDPGQDLCSSADRLPAIFHRQAMRTDRRRRVADAAALRAGL